MLRYTDEKTGELKSGYSTAAAIFCLKRYEDAGLTPDEVKEISKMKDKYEIFVLRQEVKELKERLDEEIRKNSIEIELP